MVWTFVRLKLRLIRNNLKTGWQAILGLVLGLSLGIPVSIQVFVALALSRGRPWGAGLLSGVFVASFVGWLTLPLMAFGSDETLDPSRLALLPLTRRRLMTGLLAASGVGIAPLLTLFALAGAVIGFAPAGPGAAVVVAAVVVHFLVCICASRALTTALSRALRSRRGRDVAILVITLFMGLSGLLMQGLIRASGVVRGFAEGSASSLGAVPGAWAARAITLAASGRTVLALVPLLASAALAGLLLIVWSRSLERALTTSEAAGRSSRGSLELFGGASALLPRNRTGAVAAKEIRYVWREPRRRAQAVMSFIIGTAALLYFVILRDAATPQMTMMVAVMGVMSALGSLNQFGMDGRALWMNVAAGGDVRSDIAGKNIGLAFITVPVLVVDGVLLAALTRGWAYLPATALLSVGGIAAAVGVGNVVSVVAPMAVPDSKTNVWGMQGGGQGFTAGFINIGAMLVTGLLLLPMAIPAIRSAARPGFLIVIGAVAAVYGMCVWWAGLAIATARLRARPDKLLEAVAAERAS